jgi:HAD superfamily hydrolase (TIGR01509 family)
MTSSQLPWVKENLKLNVKAVIFDLDGTLVDSRPAYRKAAEVAFAFAHLGKPDAKVFTELPRRMEQDLPIDDLIDGAQVETFKSVYLHAYYQATMEKSVPLSHVADALEKLSCKAALAVTTRRNVPESEVRKELAKLGLDRYFKRIVTSQCVSNPKPSPEAIVTCAEPLGVKLKDCAVVGDSIIDIRAGKNAGAHTIAVLTGIFSREELEKEKPDLVLRSVSELPSFLE